MKGLRRIYGCVRVLGTSDVGTNKVSHPVLTGLEGLNLLKRPGQDGVEVGLRTLDTVVEGRRRLVARLDTTHEDTKTCIPLKTPTTPPVRPEVCPSSSVPLSLFRYGEGDPG